MYPLPDPISHTMLEDVVTVCVIMLPAPIPQFIAFKKSSSWLTGS